jgi:hypothetical protein
LLTDTAAEELERRLADEPDPARRQRLEERYPGGVIWLKLGPSYTTAESVGPVISELAAFAYSGDVQAYQALSLAQPATSPEQILSGLHNALFKPEAVRLLLSGHGPLLIVADDVWDRSVLGPIRAALPADASLLVTTRDSRVANGVGNALELDVLSNQDALAMIGRTLPNMDPTLANELALTVGRHPRPWRSSSATWPSRTRRTGPNVSPR